MTTLLAAILFLGVLILVHELGHLLAARSVGIKVERFSIGFGPKLFGFTAGETEYKVSLLPLGGYVRLLGQDDGTTVMPEDLHRSFSMKPRWQRAWVIVAGPLSNLIFPFIVYAVFLFFQAEMIGTTLGRVHPGAPADLAGVRAGDTIVAVDGSPVRYWNELTAALKPLHDRETVLGIERDGKRLDLKVRPFVFMQKNEFGEQVPTGMVGISPNRIRPVVGVPAGTPAHAAGLRTGDLLLTLGGRPVSDWIGLRSEADRLAGSEQPVELTVRRNGVELPKMVLAGSAVSGLESPTDYIGEVAAGTPAAEAGLQAGDRLLTLNGRPLLDFMHLHRLLAGSPEAELAVEYLRDGELRNASLRQQQSLVKDDLRQEQVPVWTLGIAPLIGEDDLLEPGMVPIEGRLGFALSGAAATTWKVIALTGAGIAKLVSGSIPAKSVGGPIMIVDVAGKAAREGLAAFVWLLAIISVNLGMINLFPIPVLDGGHLAILAIEGGLRRDISRTVRERVTMAGLVLLVLLMAFAVKNDVERYWDVWTGDDAPAGEAER